MNDRPTAVELLDAVKHFLETDVVPALGGPKKFHARVAANVMAILARQWENEEEQLRAEWNSLDALLGAPTPRPDGLADLRRDIERLTKDLCERIRAGDADDGKWRRDVIQHLRLVVRQKLEVANPEMLKSRPS